MDARRDDLRLADALMNWLTDVKFLKPSSLLLSLALAVGGCASTGPSTMPRGATSPQANAATGPVMHDLTSLQLARQMGVGWNLGNSLESTGGETAWGNPAPSRSSDGGRGTGNGAWRSPSGRVHGRARSRCT